MDSRDQQRTGLVHDRLRFKTACEIVTEMTSNPHLPIRSICALLSGKDKLLKNSTFLKTF